MKDKINSFKSNGFIHYENLLDKSKCRNLYLKLKNNRQWNQDLFQSEENFREEFYEINCIIPFIINFSYK